VHTWPEWMVDRPRCRADAALRTQAGTPVCATPPAPPAGSSAGEEANAPGGGSGAALSSLGRLLAARTSPRGGSSCGARSNEAGAGAGAGGSGEMGDSMDRPMETDD
jgi:hypothetical protein